MPYDDDDDGHANNAIAQWEPDISRVWTTSCLIRERKREDQTLSSRFPFPLSSFCFSSALLILELRDWKAVSGVGQRPIVRMGLEPVLQD